MKKDSTEDSGNNYVFISNMPEDPQNLIMKIQFDPHSQLSRDLVTSQESPKIDSKMLDSSSIQASLENMAKGKGTFAMEP